MQNNILKKINNFTEYGLYDARFEHDACGVGFICDIKGVKTNSLVQQALQILNHLSHRGATGADPRTGDGAGILIQMPDDFCRKKAGENKIKLPAYGRYASGLVFLPQNQRDRQFVKDVFAKVAAEEKQDILGWRSVPVDNSCIGKTAQKNRPGIEQIFISCSDDIKDQLAFERRLYVIRKKIENIVRASEIKEKSFFYITNLSSRTFSYKGLLMPEQMDKFFLDFKDKSLKSALCLVHSRYSTNTFPSWELAQPFRYLAHNGEINTLRGNINWMRAREGFLKSAVWGKNLEEILPVIAPGGSDSAAIDNIFELLLLSGRPPEQVMMMLIPAAWQQDKLMDKNLKDFYKYHACIMESWDGPAAIAFTDGDCVGASLDRNGLRPARYLVTKDGIVVMASEAGVLDIAQENIAYSGRLEPGKMLFIDTVKQKIIPDEQIKNNIAAKNPYSKWLEQNMMDLEDIPSCGYNRQEDDYLKLLKAFGYTREDINIIIKPMAETSQEPIGSMGNDASHAVFSHRPQSLYTYFKQLFAQVTNPAIDPIREELVMSLETYLGPEKNLLEETSQACHKLKVKRPVLTNEELDKIVNINASGFRSKKISLLFKPADQNDFVNALDRICREAGESIKEGFTFIVLSDRGVDNHNASIPALLACSAVHQYLVRLALRTQTSIIVECADAREVHHFALLFGYGADCVNPYLAYEAINALIKEKEISLDFSRATGNYIKAVDKGILKILSKMGISTLQSYRGAQIFEALGLGKDIIDKYFTGTVSRIEGASLEVIQKETSLRHQAAFLGQNTQNTVDLEAGGAYKWRKDAEAHLWNPETISLLQDATRLGDYERYKQFAGLINCQKEQPVTLRSCFKFKSTNSIPLKEVEPVEEIMKRFATGAMSFGSISRGTHETLALAMNRLGGRSNTGEGGEDPARFKPLANGDSKRSSIKQVASGRFGVTTNYLVNADELQIKIAQGAKPGEGGQLPGHKVSVIIAKTRYTTPGVTLISPPPHHDIYSIEDLAQLIFDLKNTNPDARISVKLVSEIGVGTIAAGVAKGHADMILISGGDGGTGASPLSSIKHAGMPWELGLAETHQSLLLNDLRNRVRLQADGQMRTGRDVAVAALLGAEEYGFCTAALIVLGCAMLRHCHLNNCSLGVATQDELLEARFRGKQEHVENYFRFVANELREIMAALGFRKLEEMVGRSDLLETDTDILPWKAKGVDFSRIFFFPETSSSQRACTMKQDHPIKDILDLQLIDACSGIFINKKSVKLEFPIFNTNRTTGAMLSGKICKAFGEEGLAEDTIQIKFKGVAGQSFAAWLCSGVTFELEGMANDYVGKGISGGKVIIYPNTKTDYNPQDNIVIGNTSFYGAINGQAYILGKAGERFCIRNSGLYAVVEGVGDHACEYMTGGRVVVLGETGRNFGAGMSGGIAYVYLARNFQEKCNMEMVALENLENEDLVTIRNLLVNHHRYTKSLKAKEILDDFNSLSRNFIKIMPLEYKRVLGPRRTKDSNNLDEASDG
ncbi:MAG: glutamate synthase large subunit [Candidatus Omnitrophica bacterium]|jgi:glutamate synthase domain-containing protein 2/glutamate synthase domain-containing protein 1/glutamate synthase domain-containing protein 3|nr:glutamate synthase large subunit [Candidatus Omnitrophota bacterium]